MNMVITIMMTFMTNMIIMITMTIMTTMTMVNCDDDGLDYC